MKLIKSVSVYTFSNIFNSGISFLLLPIFTKYLSPADYGYLSLTYVMVALVAPFIHLAIHSGVQVEYFKLGKNDLPKYVSSGISNCIFSALIFVFILTITAPTLEGWLNYPAIWMSIIPIIAFLQVVPNFLLSIFQIESFPFKYAKYSLSMSLSNMALGLLLVIVFKLNWEGRVISWVATYSVFTIIGVLVLIKKELLKFKISKKYSMSALQFGIPLIPHLIGSVVIDSLDRLFITKMVGVEQLGIYNVGYQVGMVISLIQHSFTLAYTPILFKNLKSGGQKNKIFIVRISYLFVFGLVVFLGLLWLVSPIFFEYLIDSRFSDGIKFVFWVGLGYLFLGMYKMVTGYIFYLKRTTILGYLSVFNVALNIVLNYYLILKFGALGAAYATVLSYLALFIIVAIISYKLYPMPWFRFTKILNFN